LVGERRARGRGEAERHNPMRVSQGGASMFLRSQYDKRSFGLCASARLLVDRVDLVLALEPLGELLLVGLLRDRVAGANAAERALPQPSHHPGVVSGEPAPLLPGGS